MSQRRQDGGWWDSNIYKGNYNTTGIRRTPKEVTEDLKLKLKQLQTKFKKDTKSLELAQNSLDILDGKIDSLTDTIYQREKNYE